MYKRFFLFLLSLVTLEAGAYDFSTFEYEGIYYYVTGDGYAAVKARPDGTKYSGDVVIPRNVTYYNNGRGFGFTVSEIMENAFKDCYDLIGIAIPNSITRIRSSAFANCTGLTGVLSIPSSVTSIGDNAFDNCRNVRHLELNEGLIEIGNSAFFSCGYANGDGKLFIPNSVTSLGANAFGNCPIRILALGSGVGRIQSGTFDAAGSRGVCDVYVWRESPPIMGNDNFKYGINLHLPANSWSAYQNADGWQTILKHNNSTIRSQFSFKEGDIYYVEFGGNNRVMVVGRDPLVNDYRGVLTVPATVTHDGITYTVTGIGPEAFARAKELNALYMPDNINQIYDYAFYESGIGQIAVPDAVTRIGSFAFNSCPLLTDVTLGRGLTEINDRAFINSPVMAITSKASTPPTYNSGSLSYDMFSGDTYSNATLKVPRSAMETYGSANEWSKFENIEGLNFDFEEDGIAYVINSDGTAGVTRKPSGIYTGIVTIPATVTHEGVDYAVTSIEDNAFSASRGNLSAVHLPEGLLTIGVSAFAGAGLREMQLPSTVTSIGTGAFANCTLLSRVTMGENLKTISANAFVLSALDYIVCMAVTPPTTATAAFTSTIYDQAKVYVPAEAFENYSRAIAWKNFKNLKARDSEVIEFACDAVRDLCVRSGFDTSGDEQISYSEAAAVTDLGGMFGMEGYSSGAKSRYAITSFDELQYFTGITKIGYRQLSMNWSMTSVTLPPQITEIGEQAFEMCYSLESITLPSKVTAIGANAFYSDSTLVSVNMADSKVTRLENYAFSGCTHLEEVKGMNKITYFGRRAFYNCYALKNHTMSPKLTYIDEDAFRNCRALAQEGSSGCPQGVFPIPATVTYVGSNAFKDSGVKNFLLMNSKPRGTVFNAFWSTGDDITVYVPYQLYDSIQTRWSSYAGDIFRAVVTSEFALHAFDSDVQLEPYAGSQALDIYTVTRRIHGVRGSGLFGINGSLSLRNLRDNTQYPVTVPAGLPFAIKGTSGFYGFLTMKEPDGTAPAISNPYLTCLLHNAKTEPPVSTPGTYFYIPDGESVWNKTAVEKVSGVYAAVEFDDDEYVDEVLYSSRGQLSSFYLAGRRLDEDKKFTAEGVSGSITVDKIVQETMMNLYFYLTFDNAVITKPGSGGGSTGLFNGHSGVVYPAIITFKGRNSINGFDTGLYDGNGLTLRADEKASLNISASESGIRVGYRFNIMGPLTLDAKGNNVGIMSFVGTNSLGVSDESVVKATGPRDGSVIGFADIKGVDGVNESYFISKPAGAVYDTDLKAVTLNGEIVKTQVVIGEDDGVVGDVNGDGVVSGADVTALYGLLLDDKPVNGNADVSGDGLVSGADVTALYNLLLQ